MEEPTIERKRRRYSAEQKQTILAAYEQRTTNQARFCLEQGVSLPTLHSWLGKTRRSGSDFVEIAPQQSLSSEPGVQVELRDGTVLRISQGTDPRWLRQLLLVLRCGA